MTAAPPLWQIDIQKRLGEEYWTNVYHIARSDRAAAISAANDIAGFEITLHLGVVEFVSHRVAPFPGPSEGTVTPIGLFGGAGNDAYLPLFNCLRVDFPVLTGRPSRKFYRIPLTETAQQNGVLVDTVRQSLQDRVDAFFASPVSAGLCDVDGQLITSGRVMPSVAMRQLRRGSRKRTTPVI